MNARDKLLCLRAQNEHGSRTVKTAKSPVDPLLTVLTVANPSIEERDGHANTAPSRSEPHFPESHCSECGKVGGADDPLIGAGGGYLRHGACIPTPRQVYRAADRRLGRDAGRARTSFPAQSARPSRRLGRSSAGAI
jgi:hypothetical protein